MNNTYRSVPVQRASRLNTMFALLLLSGAAVYGFKVHAEEKPFLGMQEPVNGERLKQSRGTSDFKTANLNDVHGSVQNNSAVDVISGNNTITNGSFSHVTGFPVVVQNSGSNVVIQSSTIVNIGLQP